MIEEPDTLTAAAVDLIALGPLMALGPGSPDIVVALVDGTVAVDHPDLAGAHIRSVADDATACTLSASSACVHGTFVAGILVAKRGSRAPAICPGCTLLVRPIFRETHASGAVPVASAQELGHAITECVDAGARIINLSAATGEPTTRGDAGLRQALDRAARRGTIVVAAAGNQATLGSSEITRHPGVIPVVAYDLAGQPLEGSNFGRSPGRWGVGAPGDGIVSLSAHGTPVPRTGTSFAAAFVSGALALLWSRFPAADSTMLRAALAHGGRRTSVIPPLMDAHAAHERLLSAYAWMQT